MDNNAHEEKTEKNLKTIIRDYFRDFKVLKETKSEYWGIQVVNFLDSAFYFAMLTIASVFLSENIGLDDKNAGYSMTLFTTTTTIMLFFSGLITDWLGIRKSLYVSLGSLLTLRFLMVIIGLVPSIPYRGVFATVVFFLMAPFMASLQTIFQAANARFTTKKSRSAGFNLWYLFMNIGAAAAGFLIDFIRKVLQLDNTHIFSCGVVTAILCVLTTISMVRKEEQLLGADEKVDEKKSEIKVEKKNPFQIVQSVIKESAFWKLIVLIFLLLGVRAVFLYMYLLMPKYWLRVIGPDAAIGVLNTINPIGIVIGLIIFIPITNKFNVFSMLVYGAMISAVSLAPMALPWQVYGADIITAHYIMAVLCMILLTLGEIIWSPKLNEYTAAIAPAGQEGTYLGLTMVPWFLAKTVVSLLSGHMLEKWSPEKFVSGAGEMPLQKAMSEGLVTYWQSPSAMWLILCGVAIAGSIVSLMLKGWFTSGANWKSKN